MDISTESILKIKRYRMDAHAQELIRFRRRHLPTGLSLADELKLWEWKVAGNPYREETVPDAYVARRDAEIVGLLTLMPARFQIGGGIHSAIGLADFCVDSGASGAGIDLLGRAIEEHGDRILFAASANAASSRLFNALKFHRIPTALFTAKAGDIRGEPADGRRVVVGEWKDGAKALFGQTTALSQSFDSAWMEWRYGRYPLASSKYLSLTGPDGREAGHAVYQVSRLDAVRCLVVMEFAETDPSAGDGLRQNWPWAFKQAADMESCTHVLVSMFGGPERSVFEEAGFRPVAETESSFCWIKWNREMAGRPADAETQPVSLGFGDRFFTNVYMPPVGDGSARMFSYRLKDSPQSLSAIAGRQTLLIRTSPFDHWSFVLEKFLELSGPGNVTVLSNADMPESFSYVYPSFRVLKYPRGRLDHAALPPDVIRELQENIFDQVILTTHDLSAKYPREILESFSNILHFTRAIWPRDSLPVWAADWSYELRRLDDHYYELESSPKDAMAREYLSVMIKNRLTPLMKHVESFNALVARPVTIDRFEEQNMLIIAPHADDDIIGCGGTIIKNVRDGKKIRTVYLTDGAYESGPVSRDEMARIRKDEALKVAAELGVEPVFLDCPANPTFSIRSEKVAELTDMARAFAPDAIWVPFVFDQHPDHRRANVMLAKVISALGPRRINVYSYEVWTAAPANTLVDITDCMDRKRRALAMFKSQTAAFDYVHSTTGLNGWRSRWVNGSGYYEAFLKLSGEDYVSLIRDVNGIDRM